MKLPIIQGTIRRRILVNFRVDPVVMQRHLPPAFKPKLHAGSAIAGICLIRLESIRPKGLPAALGISSENAAHRIAVTWNDGDQEKEGVFIPRRDTGSTLNHLAGGRVFPGEHHLADFRVSDTGAAIDFEMRSRDGEVAVQLRGRIGEALPTGSQFKSLAEASSFFESGSIGYSVTKDSRRLDGIFLRTKTWKMQTLDVDDVQSSYFADEKRFPVGSVNFDCSLIMRDIEHEWQSEPDLYA
jgi:uncharacterized protein YqjF (DUF2071 family)